MRLEELTVYQMAMDIGEDIWKIVLTWDYFLKDTIGKQLIRAADSISANLSEGFGRYHYKENRQFSYYSRGSLYETKTWLTKAYNRNLITDTQFQELIQTIETIAIKLNNYINSIGKHANDKK